MLPAQRGLHVLSEVSRRARRSFGVSPALGGQRRGGGELHREGTIRGSCAHHGPSDVPSSLQQVRAIVTQAAATLATADATWPASAVVDIGIYLPKSVSGAVHVVACGYDASGNAVAASATQSTTVPAGATSPQVNLVLSTGTPSALCAIAGGTGGTAGTGGSGTGGAAGATASGGSGGSTGGSGGVAGSGTAARRARGAAAPRAPGAVAARAPGVRQAPVGVGGAPVVRAWQPR